MTVLYKGCVIPARLPFIEAASRFILNRLDLDVKDMVDEICCMEPVGLRSLNNDVWLSVSSGIQSVAAGQTIVTLCDGCSVSLTSSAEERGSGSEVKGFVELLYENIDAIRDSIVKPAGLELAVFPGCHCESTCSKKGLDANVLMSEILSVAGGTPFIPKKNICCGGGVSGIDDALSKAIMNESVDSFKATGASGVMTSCPFCFMQFDMVARFKTYHVAEIVAAAMGWDVDFMRYHRGR